MIEIGINQIYKNFGYKNVLNGVSCEIMSGERVGLVGRNGTGKSTIFQILTGLESPDKGTISIRRGAIVGYLEQIPIIPSSETTTQEVLSEAFADINKVAERMHQLEQEMTVASNSDTLQTLMNEYAKVQNEFISMDGYNAEEQFQRIVHGFDLTSLLEKRFSVLSGGEKTLIKLARTILESPDILLLDEPTNHLDLSTTLWLEDYLSKYPGTVLIISHDRQFLDRVTTKTVFLENGTAETYHGNYTFALQEQKRLLLLEFEAFNNQQKKISAIKAAIRRFRDWGARNPDNVSFFRKAKELERRLEKLDQIDKPQLEKKKIPLNFSGDHLSHDVISLDGLHIAFQDHILLDDVNVKIFEKEKICLMGDNGSGKTTLIHSILGSFCDFKGVIALAPSAKIGFIPQEIRFENGEESVLTMFQQAYPCPEHTARHLLARYFFYGDHVFKRISVLSGGEKILLKLAILMMQNVNLLILDEPTNHIDIETREMLEEALLSFPSTLLFISHDRYFIRKIANRILEIKDRDIVSFYGDYGTYENYRSPVR